jgi:mRNA-degrading endonuclease RelE of RelBE toxin-antitoxin system/antitoxin (DNA-binding transcriptional repressor) of toxin-antitoxin stability system
MGPFGIRFAPAAVTEWQGLDPLVRRCVAPGARRRLTLHPTRVDPHWIARLGESAGAEYRLKFGPLRIFYDVHEREVRVLAIAMLPKLEPPGALRRRNSGPRVSGQERLLSVGGRTVRAMALTEVKKGLSKCVRMASEQPIVITRHGKVVGLLVAFADEEEWLEYRLRHEPGFLERIQQARRALRVEQETSS